MYVLGTILATFIVIFHVYLLNKYTKYSIKTIITNSLINIFCI